MVALFCLSGLATNAFGSEAAIKIPDLTEVKFDGLGGVSGVTLMYLGIVICLVGAVFGLFQYMQTKALPVHEHGRGFGHHLGNLQDLPVPRRANSWPSSGC